MLRLDGKIEVEDPVYLDLSRLLAESVGVSFDKLEFTIDLVSGNPLHIFKARSKNISYNLNDIPALDKKPQITDSQREDLLILSLGGCETTLNQLFYRWHHLSET